MRYASALFTLMVLFVAGEASSVTFDVTKTTDTADGVCGVSDCSLREAIIAANASPGFDVINVPAGVFFLSLTGGWPDTAASRDLDLTDDVRIQGQGIEETFVDGDDRFRVFEIEGGTVATLTDMTIQNGNSNYGGGIRNEGTLTLIDTWVYSNYSGEWGMEIGHGAGIYNWESGTLQVIGSTISHNQTANRRIRGWWVRRWNQQLFRSAGDHHQFSDYGQQHPR